MWNLGRDGGLHRERRIGVRVVQNEVDAVPALRANREPPMDMGIRYVDLDEERKDTLRKYINMVRK